MKKLKKMIAVVLAVTVAMTMGIATTGMAFAAKTVDVQTGTGSITLDNGTTGEKYQLYKVFDATYSGDNVSYTFTKTEDNAAFYNLLKAEESPFTLTETATSGVYSVVKKSDATDSAVLTWVETNVKDKAYLKVGAEITLAEADNQKIEWTNLAFGYYMITSTLDDFEEGNSHVTIDSNVPDVTVIDKNQTPTLDKNIVDDPDNPVKVNEAGLKEDVDFDITVKSKNYVGEEKIFKYVVYDTMEAGWTMKAAPVVKVAGQTLTADNYTITYKDKAGTATTDINKAEYFEITIPWTTDGTIEGNHLYKANDEINVTYTAFLDPAKADDVKVGATPNKNEAEVKYFKDNKDGGPDSTTPSGTLPKVTTETYDTSLTITKTDGSQALTGAEFQLTSTNGTQVSIVTGQEYVVDENGTYWKLKDGTYTTDDPNTEGMDQSKYDSTEIKYALKNVANVIDGTAEGTDLKAFVGEDGKLSFSGLGAGDYKLIETTVPSGYNKADDIEFTISFNAETKKFASSNDAIELDATNNVFKTTVVNNAGTELPSTGGMGTTIFYILGALLVVGCGVILIARRRMSSNS